jgi:hypothetical protein
LAFIPIIVSVYISSDFVTANVKIAPADCLQGTREDSVTAATTAQPVPVAPKLIFDFALENIEYRICAPNIGVA